MTNQNREEIIWRSLQGECSEKELLELQRWRDSSTRNDREYQEIKEIMEAGKYLKGLDLLDKKSTQKKVMRQIKRKTTTRPHPLSYAAIFLLPLLTGAYFFYHFEFPREKENSLISIAKSTLPGEAHALLYLSDGRTIDLKHEGDTVIVDGGIYQGFSLTKRGNSLHYIDSKSTGDDTKLAFNKIVVPRGGEYMLVLADGTNVWLNSETELEYPLAFGKGNREVRLKGEAFFEVAKNESKPFHVLMDEVTIEVKGTSFNACYYPLEGRCDAALASGKITMLAHNQVKEVAVGELVSYDRITKEMHVEPVDLKYYTAWRHGTFYFYNTPLSDIVRQLGRWYNVDFEFSDESLKNTCFSGAALRTKPIDCILDVLAGTGTLEFKILKNEKIVIYRR